MTTTARPAKQEPTHTNLSCVKHHGCTRPECRQRYRDWQKRRYRRQGYGTWQPYVDAEPVRQHLLKLRAAGISYGNVARQAGLYPATVSSILYHVSGRPRKKKLRPETAQKILAVQPRRELLPAGRTIDATGTRRRLQALVAAGWPMIRLGEHINVHPNQVRRLTQAPHVFVRTARSVADAYNRLTLEDPEAHGVTPGAVLKAKRFATKHGWAPPPYWDDDAFDDPNFVPATSDKIGKHAEAHLIAEEIRHLAYCGESPEQIAAKVGKSPKYVRAQLNGNRKPGWRAEQRQQEQGVAA